MGTTNAQILKEVGSLSAQVDGIYEEQKVVNRLMLGDGQPGALERLTRLEERMVDLTQTMQEATQNARQILAHVGEFESHINDKKKHNLHLDRKTIAAMIGGFSMLYLFFEYVPYEKTLAMLLKLLGL